MSGAGSPVTSSVLLIFSGDHDRGNQEERYSVPASCSWRAAVNLRLSLPLNHENAPRSLVQAREGMIHQHIGAGHIHLEVCDSCAASRHQRSLHITVHQPPGLVEHAVKDFPNDMEAAYLGDAAIADKQTDRFTDPGAERPVDQRVYPTVPDHIVRHLLLHLLTGEHLEALLAYGTRGIDLTLHHIEFPIHCRQSALRFDDNQAVHPVGHMRRDIVGCTVVDIGPGIEGLEGESLLLAWSNLGGSRATARAVNSM